jgi:hypothetical protein
LGRDYFAIDSKLRSSKAPTEAEKINLQVSTKWTVDSVEKLKKMFDEKKTWTNDELLLHFGRTYQQCNWKYSKLKNQQDSLEDSEIKVTRPRDWARFIKSCKNSLTAVYYGASTTNRASENGLQRVNYKILLYRVINKPTYDSTIVFSISRLVITHIRQFI